MKPTHTRPAASPRGGMALVIIMLLVAALLLLGGTVFRIFTLDLRTVGYERDQAGAFSQADAGARYLLSRIHADVKGKTLTLGSPTVAVSYPAPAGLTFDTVTNLVRLADGATYAYRVTSRLRDAAATVDVTFKPLIGIGGAAVFGHALLDMQNQSKVIGYDSALTPDPTPADADGSADVASNTHVEMGSWTVVDGDLDLGEAGGSTATYNIHKKATVNGTEGDPEGPIDQDPEGIIGGDMATQLNAAKTSNNNANAIPPLVGNVLYAETTQVVTLPAGVYYLEDFYLVDHCALNVTGPVRIYVEGRLTIRDHSTVNAGGDPANLFIYSTNGGGGAPASDTVTVRDQCVVKGSFYAPYASIELLNQTKIYGSVWGNRVAIHDWSYVYHDSSGAATGDPTGTPLEWLESWKRTWSGG